MAAVFEPFVADMPDFTVRGIDNAVAERIKEIARARNWAINDVMIDLLKQALNMNPATRTDTEAVTDPKDVALLAGTWGTDEAAAFRAALEALEQIPLDVAQPLGKAR
ncbi:MAG: hypothetical protein COS34_13175 [Lysobacterales bacterium CG02_land_8_20_14_3_00_62_12]|nr:MAG: hypothetical protein COS34_13175 [Xanthomonadales bacterium CG02_land_8_20_14_3_00_62_12]